jgi:enoyl-CoA hydratase/carnithine racemase
MNDGPVLAYERHNKVLRITLNRANKRNALNDSIADAFESVLADMDPDVKAIVLDGAGDHFCAGLDLSEQRSRSPIEVVQLSRRWHSIKERLQYGRCPIIAALHGAVIGGGFELAAVAHIRVADPTAFFQLPEGRRGIFIGGGGSVRIARLIGVSRLGELMLTGRRLEAEAAERMGLIHYLAPPGSALRLALELAAKVADNAPTVNYLILQALPRIADMSASDGLFTESLAAGLSQSSPEAQAGIAEFLASRGSSRRE